jgi:hypothetical protein
LKLFSCDICGNINLERYFIDNIVCVVKIYIKLQKKRRIVKWREYFVKRTRGGKWEEQRKRTRKEIGKGNGKGKNKKMKEM